MDGTIKGMQYNYDEVIRDRLCRKVGVFIILTIIYSVFSCNTQNIMAARVTRYLVCVCLSTIAVLVVQATRWSMRNTSEQWEQENKCPETTTFRSDGS